MKKNSAYREAGVDRNQADRLVSQIFKMTKKQIGLANVRSQVGGYASLYELTPSQWLAASTDGVGTKLKLAFEQDHHHTVGIDLVAMSVNDLLCVGATPLFFLDYFATGKLKNQTAARVLQGIIQGCRDAKCVLVGGETAEMPGFYQAGEYDLAGFAVGALHPKSLLPKKSIKPGDVLIGLPSSGFHSNGYSLLRKLLKEFKPLSSSPTWMKNKKSLANELLIPTCLYSKALLPLISSGKIKGLAHITGSGFLNVPRMSEEVSYEITLPPLKNRARIFQWLKDASDIPFQELTQTFNMGVGMVITVSPKDLKAVLASLKKSGEKPYLLGHTTHKRGKCKVIVHDESGRAELNY
jgi:phosphoribosylformylglycinamidine cyclo-ligase